MSSCMGVSRTLAVGRRPPRVLGATWPPPVRRPAAILLVVLVAVGVAACGSSPPDRVAFTTVESAVDVVQAAVRTFNHYYDTQTPAPGLGRVLTAADRAKAQAAYEKFQVTARQALPLILDAAQGTNAIQIVSDAAVAALKILEGFTGPVPRPAPQKVR